MIEKIRNFFSGISSVLDIYPNTDYLGIMKEKSPDKMMEKDWKLVGEAMRTAINQIENEQQVQEEVQ